MTGQRPSDLAVLPTGAAPQLGTVCNVPPRWEEVKERTVEMRERNDNVTEGGSFYGFCLCCDAFIVLFPVALQFF